MIKVVHRKGEPIQGTTGEELNKLIYKEIFFVRVPELAIYEEGDNVPYDEVNGKLVERDLTRRTTVGLPIKRIAELALSGMAVDMLARADVIKLYKKLEEFLEGFDKLVLLPNLTTIEQQDYKLVESFAKEMLKHQETRIRSTRITLETIVKELGLIPTMDTRPNEPKEIKIKTPYIDLERY